ncbi:hypothetical protein CBR_g32333 [Chara braunii]|uniref:Reverse transcriptase domain-containing protein n=1 Tax=Chara braunii TaxID=69332 RepID=A0A388JNG7_CHABU|nr:hypothetical protein CBR_g32333 [Chara braunii]|eukprot:GBG59321.1 hypothetical protein CBR_g32333 [Chara braunii]
MLTEKDQLVSADEEKIKTVGRMTNVAFRLGKAHALGDVVVLDVNTYDVLFGLPALVALRANLDFERRLIVLRNTGGKLYVVPMRLTLRTTTNVTPRVSPMMVGTLRVITWDNFADDGQPSKDTDSSDEDNPVILEMAQQRTYYPMQRANTRSLSLADQSLQRTQAMIMGEPLVQILRMVDSLEPPRTLYEAGDERNIPELVNKTRLIQGMINFCVIVYMDDILVYSETYHGHAQHIEWTLGALRDVGFKIALEKSEFFLSEISFLGYVVTRGGLRPDSRKVAAVKDAPVPMSVTHLTWTRDVEHRAWVAYMELLIIQAWRTEVEGDLLGFLFGSVRPDYRQQIVQELTIPLTQLVDDLPLDIISQSDESPVPHVSSRTLTPYLQWSACLEELAGNNNPPSHQPYLDPRGIIDLAFFQPRTASEDEVIALEEEEEENEEGSEEKDEAPNEGSYSEHSDDEEEEEVEEEESEWETLGEEAARGRRGGGSRGGAEERRNRRRQAAAGSRK